MNQSNTSARHVDLTLKPFSLNKGVERIVELFCFVCAGFSLITTASIVGILLYEVSVFFTQVSFSQFFLDTEWTPLFYDKHFGIWPLVTGTLLTSLIAMSVALPLGLLLAIYLSEFAPSWLRKTTKPIIEVLAGIPSIVFGYFALLTVSPFLQMFIPGLESFNALAPGLVMGIMILPLVTSLSEDALYVVPRSFREGAYAMGATKLQAVLTVVVPAAFGGITAASILALARAVGETMIVAIAAGQQPQLHMNPLQPIETMTAYIVQVSLGDTPHGTLEYQTIFAVAAMLFLLTLVLNLISLRIRERFKRMYQ